METAARAKVKVSLGLKSGSGSKPKYYDFHGFLIGFSRSDSGCSIVKKYHFGDEKASFLLKCSSCSLGVLEGF